MTAVRRLEHILVVVDPTADSQPALERGIYLAKKMGMAIDLFTCQWDSHLSSSRFYDSSDLKYAREQDVQKELAYLTNLARPFSKQGLTITVKAAWDTPLYEGIIREALRTNPRFVLKDTHCHSAVSRAMFTNADWHLIQFCPMPLWLVKPGRVMTSPAILAAVDPIHEHDKPASLDTQILSEAFDLADGLDGIVHAFHGFSTAATSGWTFSPAPLTSAKIAEEMEKAHTAAFAELTEKFQLPPERSHLKSGTPAELLPCIAREVSADLVVMGAVARSRIQHAIIGSTAERTLDQLPCDVLVIKPGDFESPVTFKSQPRGAVHAEREGICEIAV